jgi:hypothetical protein
LTNWRAISLPVNFKGAFSQENAQWGISMRAVIVSAIIALGLSLSGCVVYDVASTAVDVTGSVVGAAADVAGAVVSAPFGSSDKKPKN